MNSESRIALGRELARLRKRAKLTLVEAGKAGGISRAQLSKIELGTHRTTVDKVKLLASIYEATTKEIDHLVKLVPPRTRKAKPESPTWAADYYTLENESIKISSYDPQLVPGLLQIPAYTEALFAVWSTDDVTVEALLKLRQKRQTRVADQKIKIDAILDEAVLSRQVGGMATMANQVDHLVKISDLPNVTVTILPYSAGAHIAMAGVFQILYLDPQLDMDTVYIEHDHTGLRLTGARDLARYEDMMESLRRLSLSPADSREWMRSIALKYREGEDTKSRESEDSSVA